MIDKLIEGVAFVDSWVPSVHFKDAPGSIVSASYRNETILETAYGKANIENAEPMTIDHQFQIASQSKVFTATAIMQLQEKNILNISHLVAEYVPELDLTNDERLRSITIEQLLTHSAGLSRDGPEADFWELRSEFPDIDRLLTNVITQPLTFEPDSQMKYSNIGYGLLGIIIERSSGMTYENYLRKHIFTPLHIGQTSVGRRPSHAPVSSGYGGNKNNRQLLIDLNTNALTPATGLYSTAHDLLTFYGQFLDNDQHPSLLSLNSIAHMSTAHGTMPYSGGVEYGLGMDIGTDNGVKIIGHGGGYPGHRSGTTIDAENGIIVTAFANSIDTDAFMATIDIARVFRYFIKNGGAPRPDRKMFNVKLASIWQDRQILTVGDSVVSIDPLSKDPFSDEAIEILTPVDEHTFQITQASGFGHPGEYVSFPEDDSSVVVYRGRRLFKQF